MLLSLGALGLSVAPDFREFEAPLWTIICKAILILPTATHAVNWKRSSTKNDKALNKTIDSGRYRTSQPAISHTKIKKCIVKHGCLTIDGVFAHHRKRPKPL